MRETYAPTHTSIEHYVYNVMIRRTRPTSLDFSCSALKPRLIHTTTIRSWRNIPISRKRHTRVRVVHNCARLL